MLLTHLWFLEAGQVSQTAKVKTRHGSVKACSVEAKVAGAGPFTLRCKLSAAIRRRLGAHGLTLRVRTSFSPKAAAPESSFNRVRLARIAAH